MAKRSRKTCPRCGGSGRFSFHPTRGTVCFQCNGLGYILVDEAKEAKRRANAAVKAADNEARRQLMSDAYWQVVNEMNALYGPFDVTTALGIDQLNYATAKATGKALHVIRDERIKNTLRR